MTTPSVKVDRANNLAHPNDVLGYPLAVSQNLAAVSWVKAGGNYIQVIEDLFHLIYDLIANKLRGYSIWLLLGSATWQPNTHVVRHRGLWGALKLRGLEILSEQSPPEMVLASEGKLKFFGAKRVGSADMSALARVLLEEECCYIVAIPGEFDVATLLNCSWTGDLRKDTALLTSIHSNGGIIFKRLGAFDDSERGFVAIGNRDDLTELSD